MTRPLFSFCLVLTLAALPALWRSGRRAPTTAALEGVFPSQRSPLALRHALEQPASGPAPHCGARLLVVGALVDPRRAPDRTGEWVTIANVEPTPVLLTDWWIDDGRRRRPLDGVIAAGERLTLGAGGPALAPIRLANGGGRVALVDPCGITSSALTWGPPECPSPTPGEGVRGTLWPRTRDGPDRTTPGGADGGCGQT